MRECLLSFGAESSVFHFYIQKYKDIDIQNCTFALSFCTRGCWYVISLTRKGTGYCDQTRDLFNMLPTKLNTLLSPSPELLQEKKNRMLSVQPGLRGSNDLRVGRKMATFQLFFQSREQVVVQRGQIRRIGWVIQDLGSPGRPVSSRLQVPGEPGHYRARTRPPWWPSRGWRFSLKMSFNCTSRDE